MENLFSELSPMLFYETEIFDSKDYIYELKFDGIRCLAYLDDKTTLINKRKKNVSNLYPELASLHKNVKHKCILDGELVVMSEGKPDFFKIQRRSLLSNQIKIDLLKNIDRVTFIAFDILYLNNKLLTNLPLLERKKILKENVKENELLVISRYIEEKGKSLFAFAIENELEGVVAKKKESKYYPGKRSRVWLKCKVYKEDDLIICGYIPSEYGIKELILGSFNEYGNLYKVATINTNKDKEIILNYAKNNQTIPLFEMSNKDEIIWLKPYLVGRVRYMMKTKNEGLRQAVFLGVRDDKVASDLLNKNDII